MRSRSSQRGVRARVPKGQGARTRIADFEIGERFEVLLHPVDESGNADPGLEPEWVTCMRSFGDNVRRLPPGGGEGEIETPPPDTEARELRS